MSEELEVLDYLEGEDCSLQFLLFALPDKVRLIKCVLNLFKEGKVQVYARTDEEQRVMEPWEVESWKYQLPEDSNFKSIIVSLRV
jgi:hypothetical protein